MILNKKTVDPSRLKVVILSCPKTGNTWLRWLIHSAYAIPIEDLPVEWGDEHIRQWRQTFVTHQHLWPSPALVQWLLNNNVTVLTTLRHPADALLSYFNFAKWQEMGTDPAAATMALDGERPGKHTLKFAQYGFSRSYAISLAWAQLGAHVVRYEDLLEDPIAELGRITSKIAPIDEYRIRAAVLTCKPANLTGPGLVDSRHIHSASSRRGVRELPAEIREVMRQVQPYKQACETYGYDWDSSISVPKPFDYNAIDPFRGRGQFDNGAPVGSWIVRVYFHEVVDAMRRWPEPTVTAGDSFWNWLVEPAPDAFLNTDMPARTLTNLMVAVHRMRPDLQAKFPDPVRTDRAAFVLWFLGQAGTEFEFPWGLVSAISDGFAEYLEGVDGESREDEGKITRVAVLDASGAPAEDFACGDEIHVEFDFVLYRPVERGVIGFILRGANGRHIFGTNTTLLGQQPPPLEPGTHRCRLSARLTIPPQTCSVSVGVARFASARIHSVHRLYDIQRITVRGAASSGPAWCDTTVAYSRP